MTYRTVECKNIVIKCERIECVSDEDRIQRICHDKYEVLFVRQGSGYLSVEGIRYRINPNSFWFIPPMAYHSVELDAGSCFSAYTVSFLPDDIFKEMYDRLPMFRDTRSEDISFAYDVDTDEIEKVLLKMANPERTEGDDLIIYYRLLLTETLFFATSCKKKEALNDASDICVRVLRYLDAAVTKNITLDFLAKRFFVSKFHLCKKFKRENLISIHSYINYKRVMLAKRFMEGGMTASEVSYQVGFGDYSTFYRTYVKVTGIAPTLAGKENVGREVPSVAKH